MGGMGGCKPPSLPPAGLCCHWVLLRLGTSAVQGQVRYCQLPPSISPLSSVRQQDVSPKHAHSEAQRGHQPVEKYLIQTGLELGKLVLQWYLCLIRTAPSLGGAPCIGWSRWWGPAPARTSPSQESRLFLGVGLRLSLGVGGGAGSEQPTAVGAEPQAAVWQPPPAVCQLPAIS